MNLELGWIPVRKSVKLGTDVAADDAIEIDVRLLPIIDETALGELLREELVRRGWSRGEDGSLTKRFGEATATLPAGSGTITLAIEGATSVSVDATEEGRGPEGDAAVEQAVQDRAQKTAERRLDVAAQNARRSLEQRNASELLAAEPDLRKDVNDAVNATTKRALERRAAALGTIESVKENNEGDGYELTITVRT